MSDAIPQFRKAGAAEVGLSGSALTAGVGARTGKEVAIIVLVAVMVIGGLEALLRWFEVPDYILPTPSLIAAALVKEFPLIAPHLGYTLIELIGGFSIGATIGLILAAVITQFPFAEKIITPYILVLVTTPMLALVPLLILRFGFGYEPRIIAVALASGPMVFSRNRSAGAAVSAATLPARRAQGSPSVAMAAAAAMGET